MNHWLPPTQYDVKAMHIAYWKVIPSKCILKPRNLTCKKTLPGRAVLYYIQYVDLNYLSELLLAWRKRIKKGEKEMQQ